MANSTPSPKPSPMSEDEVKAAILAGTFSLEKLFESLAGQKMYARAGANFRELIPENGAANIGGQYAKCFTLGAYIDKDGNKVAVRTRKPKAS